MSGCFGRDDSVGGGEGARGNRSEKLGEKNRSKDRPLQRQEGGLKSRPYTGFRIRGKMRGELFFTVEGEAEVAVDPSVFVVDDGVYGEGGRGNGDARHFFDGGTDGHEFDESAADFGDIGFDADDVFGLQQVRFVFEAGDGDFARVVNQSGEFGDFAFAEGFKCGEESADYAE